MAVVAINDVTAMDPAAGRIVVLVELEDQLVELAVVLDPESEVLVGNAGNLEIDRLSGRVLRRVGRADGPVKLQAPEAAVGNERRIIVIANRLEDHVTEYDEVLDRLVIGFIGNAQTLRGLRLGQLTQGEMVGELHYGDKPINCRITRSLSTPLAVKAGAGTGAVYSGTGYGGRPVRTPSPCGVHFCVVPVRTLFFTSSKSLRRRLA